MPRLKSDPITADELEQFLNDTSDFAFEMKVLAQLRSLGFDCSHAGTYLDPVTDKVRQYDIRAVKDDGQNTLALSVECKNFRPNHPILLSAVPRTKAESFHDLVHYHANDRAIVQFSVRPSINAESAYRTGDPVAKNINQVGKDANGKWVSSDEGTFEKVNQAVNSSRDLLVERPMRRPSEPNRRAVVPLLVVPAGILWQVDFTEDGAQKQPPRLVPHSAFFLNHAWQAKGSVNEDMPYRLSHVEFATLDALPDVVKDYFGPQGFFRS